MRDRLVHQSVAQVNKENTGKVWNLGRDCQCGKDEWSLFWGINPIYASAYNPGEYIHYTCINCGYSYEEPS